MRLGRKIGRLEDQKRSNEIQASGSEHRTPQLLTSDIFRETNGTHREFSKG